MEPPPPHMAEQKQDDRLEQQLCEDTACSHEDQPEAMNYMEMWRERGSGTSVLAAHDDDDDDDDLAFICLFILYKKLANLFNAMAKLKKCPLLRILLKSKKIR